MFLTLWEPLSSNSVNVCINCACVGFGGWDLVLAFAENLQMNQIATEMGGISACAKRRVCLLILGGVLRPRRCSSYLTVNAAAGLVTQPDSFLTVTV